MFYYESQTINVILTLFIVVSSVLCLRSAWTDLLLLRVIAWNKHEWPSEGRFKDTVEVIEMYHPIKISSMERRQWNTLRTIWPYAIIFQQQLRRNIIQCNAWNSKSVSGSKWLKIIELVTCVLFLLLVCFVIFLSPLWQYFLMWWAYFLSLSLSPSDQAPVFSSSQRDPGSCRWVCGCRLSGRRGLHQPPERDWQAGGGRLGQHGSSVSDCGSHRCLQLLSTWTPPPELLCLSQKPLPQWRSLLGHAEWIQVKSTGFPLRVPERTQMTLFHFVHGERVNWRT